MAVEFRVLGPVQIEAAGQLLPLRRRRERCLLGVLLLELNRSVPPNRLIDLLWEGAAPPNARRTLSSHISRIRALLAGDRAARLVSTSAGYELRADPERLDAQRFRRMIGSAGAIGALPERVEQLTGALRLWRGRPLADAASDQLRDRLCADLEELRLGALEELMAARLEWGGEPDPVPELTRLTREHPGRERMVAIYMGALARTGRRVEALTAYERTRAHLGQTLGVAPCPDLRRLHQRLLREELHPADRRTGPHWITPPRQLPRDVPGFTGRAGYLRQLDRLLTSEQGVPVVSTIEGLAGVGKTALALRWAHRVRHHFPDGQLYIDLRGYSTQPPRTPLAALAELLDALGVGHSAVPGDLDRAAALLRTTLAGRRVLMLLDNAAGPEQVRPLLPGEGRSLVMITSRVQLAGLVARDGALRLALPPMPQEESVRLLAALLRPVCGRAQPQAIRQLAGLCGHLPLALRVASASLAASPHRSVTSYLDRLRGSDPLSALELPGDAQSAVRVAFSLSYQRLPEPARRLFRLIGIAPGPDVTLPAAAALVGENPPATERSLRVLLTAHLLEEPVAGRYACHDLLRHYALERARDEETARARCEAVARLYGHYLRTAGAGRPDVSPCPAGP